VKKDFLMSLCKGEDDFDDYKHVRDIFDMHADEPINIFPKHKTQYNHPNTGCLTAG
jgi:hypothetical protein